MRASSRIMLSHFCASDSESYLLASRTMPSSPNPHGSTKIRLFIISIRGAKTLSQSESAATSMAISRLHFHLDRAFGAAVDELIDIGVAAGVDVLGRAVPDDLALVEHGDAVGDLAGADHVVSD